ncbi:hypothetical protein Hanom_Chr07g00609361 [Helianthus anomalus]
MGSTSETLGERGIWGFESRVCEMCVCDIDIMKCSNIVICDSPGLRLRFRRIFLYATCEENFSMLVALSKLDVRVYSSWLGNLDATELDVLGHSVPSWCP